MANFPTSIYEPRTMQNLPGLVRDLLDLKNLYAEDYNEAMDEIVAIETVLGLGPAGSYDTVKDALNALFAGAGIGSASSVGDFLAGLSSLSSGFENGDLFMLGDASAGGDVKKMRMDDFLQFIIDELADFYMASGSVTGYLIGSNSLTSPADSTTYYGGLPGFSLSTSQAYANFPIHASSLRIRSVKVVLSRTGTVPTSENVSVYLRVNTTDYLIANDIDLSASARNERTLGSQFILISPGDVVCIKIVTPAWVTNPGTIVLQTSIAIGDNG